MENNKNEKEVKSSESVKENSKSQHSRENRGLSVFIPKSLVVSYKLTEYGLATYCAVKAFAFTDRLYNNWNNHVLVSTNRVLSFLCGCTGRKFSSRVILHVGDGINELIDYEMVSLIDKVGKEYLIDCKKIANDTGFDKFIEIRVSEIQKIFETGEVSPHLLRYFITLIGTFNGMLSVHLNGIDKKNIIGNLSISTLSKMTGIAASTIIQYNKILEEKGLIYIHRTKDFILNKETKQISQITNLYCRPEDKAFAEKYSQDQAAYKKPYNYTIEKNPNANERRRLAQIYHQIANGNWKKYSSGEILSSYVYIKKENEKNRIETEKYGSSISKQRDLSVYDMFDYIKLWEEKNQGKVIESFSSIETFNGWEE